MEPDEHTTAIIFSGSRYNIIRHASSSTFTVEGIGMNAILLEMALERPGETVTDALVEALAKDASPYAPRLWKRLPAAIRQHYRTLARAALMATREMVRAG